MITIRQYRQENEGRCIEIQGHADSCRESGYDLVCAVVSASDELMHTTLNMFGCNVSRVADYGISITSSSGKDAGRIMDAFIHEMLDLEKEFPQCVRIINGARGDMKC